MWHPLLTWSHSVVSTSQSTHGDVAIDYSITHDIVSLNPLSTTLANFKLCLNLLVATFPWKNCEYSTIGLAFGVLYCPPSYTYTHMDTYTQWDCHYSPFQGSSTLVFMAFWWITSPQILPVFIQYCHDLPFCFTTLLPTHGSIVSGNARANFDTKVLETWP